MILVYFFSWTFVLYWIHRIGHKNPYIKKYHWDHHSYIIRHGDLKWEWANLFLYNDTWKSTVDLYVTEVIPTVIFSWITGQWWIFIFYYIWASTLQVVFEHKRKFNLPFFTSGEWHLIHHRHPNKNYGLFLPVWHIVFGTYKHVYK